VKRFASPCSLDSLDTGDLDIRARCSKTVRSRKQTFPRHRTTVPPADTGRPPRRIPREAVQRASPVRRDVLLLSARYRFISTHRKKVHTVRSRLEWGTHSLRSWNRPPCDLLSATLSSETLKGLFELRTGLYIVGPSVRVRSVRPPRGACRTANTDTPPTTRRTGSSPLPCPSAGAPAFRGRRRSPQRVFAGSTPFSRRAVRTRSREHRPRSGRPRRVFRPAPASPPTPLPTFRTA
jgi:hypothetical protein